MNDKKWLDLALKYGGFMGQDKIFLENRLATLTEESDKRLLVTPPASVLNAYFAELYQKRSPKDATDYFFELSDALGNFQENPHFDLEGQVGTEHFRFIRLNLSGKSFGFCFKNTAEEGIIFSEFPIKITEKLIFELAQIFPHYLFEENGEKIMMKPVNFKSDFEHIKEASALTELSENDEYIRLSGYNIEDLVEQAQQIGFLRSLLFGRDGRKHFVYISKGF
jgi:galactose-1-phosphate uridylyltransferase